VYFNTYLADPRRPQLPEHPTTRVLLTREAHLPVSAGFPGPPPAVIGYRPPPMVYPGQCSVLTSLSFIVSFLCQLLLTLLIFLRHQCIIVTVTVIGRDVNEAREE